MVFELIGGPYDGADGEGLPEPYPHLWVTMDEALREKHGLRASSTERSGAVRYDLVEKTACRTPVLYSHGGSAGDGSQETWTEEKELVPA